MSNYNKQYLQKLYNDTKKSYDMFKSLDTSKNRRNNTFLKYYYTMGIYYKAVIDKNEDKYFECYDIIKDTIYEIIEDREEDDFNVFCLNLILMNENLDDVIGTHCINFKKASEFMIFKNEGGYLKLCNFMKDVFERFTFIHNDLKKRVFGVYN